MQKKQAKRTLAFISDESIYGHVKKVFGLVKLTLLKEEKRVYKNSVDPFSALFDAFWQGISLNAWMKQERSRQNQKTLQNALGDFHQEIIGAFDGWKSLGKGRIFDVKNEKMKIIAEVKNKYNTTKGNHEVAIYDDLRACLKKPAYRGFTAYYVEIIPQNKKVYNKPFTPSDNRTHKNRPKNNNIRVIDGKSFYGLTTGDNDALEKFYKVLPKVLTDVLGKSQTKIVKDKSFIDLFKRIY